MALGLFWTLNIAISLASLALLAGLLYVYAGNLRELRSPLTLGLLLFGVAFFAQGLLAIFVYLSMDSQGMGANVAMPMLALNVTGFAGFVSLFVVTWR